MKRLFALLVLISGLLTSITPAQALIYKYVDDNGRLVFVDDESKIPPRYRQQTDQIKEEKDRLSPDEYEALQRERAQEELEQEAAQRAARKAARHAERQRALQTPVVIRGNHVMLPVEVSDGRHRARLQMVLDTGASSTVIHRSALESLKLSEGDKYLARVAGGGAIVSERVKFIYIEVGPFRAKNVSAMVIDPKGPPLPYDGLLGNDFLRHHPYEIDYDNALITWKPRN